jgi:hypothetical protein
MELHFLSINMPREATTSLLSFNLQLSAINVNKMMAREYFFQNITELVPKFSM